jgi:hypothetical protein
VEEAFDGGEEDFVGEEADGNNDEHDADDLVHGVQLAAVMQEMTEAEAGQDGIRRGESRTCGSTSLRRNGPQGRGYT